MTNYRRRRRPQKDTGKKYQINNRINYNEVRVIDDEGNLVGVMSSDEALNLANEREMDLIEINPKAVPPVVKIMSYSKFKYQQSKSEANKKPKSSKVKTLRVSVRIGPHDLSFQAKKCDEFLERDMRVKLQVQMRGREKAHPEVANDVMYDFLKLISRPFEYESEPKLMGDSYYATIKPTKGGAKKPSKTPQADTEDESE